MKYKFTFLISFIIITIKLETKKKKNDIIEEEKRNGFTPFL